MMKWHASILLPKSNTSRPVLQSVSDCSAQTRPSVHRELFHLLLTKAITQRRTWTQLQACQGCPTAVWSQKMKKCIPLPISWCHDSGCEIKSDSCITGLLQIKGLTSSKNHPTEDRGPASAFSIVRALWSFRVCPVLGSICGCQLHTSGMFTFGLMPLIISAASSGSCNLSKKNQTDSERGAILQVASQPCFYVACDQSLKGVSIWMQSMYRSYRSIICFSQFVGSVGNLICSWAPKPARQLLSLRGIINLVEPPEMWQVRDPSTVQWEPFLCIYVSKIFV